MSQITESKPFVYPHARSFNTIARIINWLAIGLCILAAIIAVSSLFGIFGYIIFRGAQNLSWAFFTHLPGPAGAVIGMRNCLIGSAILISLASLFGVPIGMLCGIYLAEYAKKGWFGSLVRLMVDVMAGVPSIVVGLLFYVLIVEPIADFHGWFGRALAITQHVIPIIGMGSHSGWSGAVALAFIMIPIVARTTEEMLKLVPQQMREASIGLGASQSQTLLRVILPAAKAGIATGIMLSVARVAGETAPLMFTALGNDQAVYDPTKPFPALTLEIYKYATSAEKSWRQQAWAAMLVLIVIIFIFNASVRFVTRNKTAARRH